MYFRRSQSALPQQNDHPHQTYPSQPPQHAPYPSPSSSSPPNPFPSQGEHTSSPVVICIDSEDDDDDSRQDSSAYLTTYPPDLGSSYLTTPPPDLSFTGIASTAHPLVDVQEQQPHPTPRDGGYPDDTERLSLEWLSDPDTLPPDSAHGLLTPLSAALSAPSLVGGVSVPYGYNQLSHFQSPQMPQPQGGSQQVAQVRFRVPEYQHVRFQNPQPQFQEQVPLLRVPVPGTMPQLHPIGHTSQQPTPLPAVDQRGWVRPPTITSGTSTSSQGSLIPQRQRNPSCDDDSRAPYLPPRSCDSRAPPLYDTNTHINRRQPPFHLLDINDNRTLMPPGVHEQSTQRGPVVSTPSEPKVLKSVSAPLPPAGRRRGSAAPPRQRRGALSRASANGPPAAPLPSPIQSLPILSPLAERLLKMAQMSAATATDRMQHELTPAVTTSSPVGVADEAPVLSLDQVGMTFDLTH